MPNDKGTKQKSFLVLLTEAFGRTEQTKPEPSYDPFDGKHVSVVTLDMWANDEFPKEFLEQYIARFGDHVAQCEKCQKNVELYKSKRLKSRL